MTRAVEVRAPQRFRLWVRYANGVEGEVDLGHLADKGVFAAWNEPGFFEQVRIGDAGEIAWGKDLDLCPDALYLKITGRPLHDVFDNLRPADARA